MTCHDHLGYRAHAHGVATDAPEVAVLSRGLKGRPLGTNIYAFHQPDAFLLGDVTCHLDEARAIGIDHCREAGSQFVNVLAVQRMLGEDVDMVGDDHEVAYLEVGVHAARGVGDEDRLDANGFHDAYREGNLLHRVALVIVEAALHRHDILVAQCAEDETALMTLNGRYREVGYFTVRNLHLDVDVVHNGPQAGAQDDGRLGQLIVHAFLNEFAGFLNLVY